MSQTAQPYLGAWTDWSHGLVRGSTITVSKTNGGLLTAFIALLVTAAGGALWKIFSYITHQRRAKTRPQDGLHHQQQIVLRNSASATTALIEFLKLTWAWRMNTENFMLKTLGPVIITFICFALVTLAGIFSSTVIKAAGNDTLTRSSSCGIWRASNPGTVISEPQLLLANANAVNSTVNAAVYAELCYSSTADPLRCNIYTKPTLPFTTNSTASCPFSSGMCYPSDATAYKLDTGKLDSNSDLGINARERDRITVQRVTTCAPLNIGGYSAESQDADSETISLGPTRISNVTYTYSRESTKYVNGYTLSYLLSYVGSTIEGLGWVPIQSLNRTDADVSIFLLAASAIYYIAPVDDPWFSAHTVQVIDDFYSDARDTFYLSDSLVTALGCSEQYQICNPGNSKCTDLSGLYVVEKQTGSIGLNSLQNAINTRVIDALAYGNLYWTVYGRDAAALQAQKWAGTRYQIRLPNNQWQLEMSYWFTTGLARLQQVMVDYAAGPPGPLTDGAYIDQPNDPESLYMCANQRVWSPSGVTSLSVLGVAVIVAVCVLIIVPSLFLDQISGMIDRQWKRSGYRHRQWVIEGKFQLQRLAYEGARMGNWSNLGDEVPVTLRGELLGMPDERNEEKPREHENEKPEENSKIKIVVSH